MKKLRFELSPNVGEVLTKDELKQVFGGGSGSGSGSGSEQCGCSGKTYGASCCYYKNGVKHYGRCKTVLYYFTCWRD